MFKYLIEKYKAWRAECQAVNAKIKADREARRLKAEEDTKQRLKDLQEAETKRREAEQNTAREAFKSEVIHAIFYNIGFMESYLRGKGPEYKVSWLFDNHTSRRRDVVRCIMQDPQYDVHYFNRLLDEEVDRYSREEVEGCNKYYALVKENKRRSYSSWAFDHENATAHIVQHVRKAVITRAFNEVMAFNTFQWPTVEEIENHPDLDLSLTSLPYQRHKLVTEDIIKGFKCTITQSRISRAITGLYYEADDPDWPINRPYNKQMRDELVNYIIACLNEEWQRKLEHIEEWSQAHRNRVREAHLKRHHVSRQKALTTGPKISKRFPLTRSIN